MSRTTRGIASVGALATLGLLAASPGLARKEVIGSVDGIGYRVFTQTPTAPADTIEVITCGLKKGKVTGGGFSQNAFSGELHSSKPVGVVKWGLKVQFLGSGQQTQDSFVICRKGKRNIEQEQLALPLNGSDTAKAKCGRGEHVIGGGAELSGAYSDNRLNSSYPYDGRDADHKPDDGWAARGVNLSSNAADVISYALCEEKAPTYVKEKGDPQGPSTTSGYLVSCPKKKHVLGGGWKITGEGDEAVVHDTYPTDLDDGEEIPDDGWRLNVENNAGDPKTVTTYAFCV